MDLFRSRSASSWSDAWSGCATVWFGYSVGLIVRRYVRTDGLAGVHVSKLAGHVGK